MQNFPNNIVPTSLYCNKYYTRCAAACQCPSDGRSLTGQSTDSLNQSVEDHIGYAENTVEIEGGATPSSATMGPRERSSGHHFCGGAAETDGTVHRSLSAHRISRQPLLARKRSGRHAPRGKEMRRRHSAFHSSLCRYTISTSLTPHS